MLFVKIPISSITMSLQLNINNISEGMLYKVVTVHILT